MSNYAAQMSLYATAQLSALMPSIEITSATATPQLTENGISVALSATATGPINDIALGRTYADLTEFLTDLLEPGTAVEQTAEVVQVEPEEQEEPEAEPVQDDEQDDDEQDEPVSAGAAALARQREAAAEQAQAAEEVVEEAPRRRRSRKAEKEAAAAATAEVAAGDDEF